jgi:hypothetical protein
MASILSLPAYLYNKFFSTPTQRETDLNTYITKGHKMFITDKDLATVSADVPSFEELKTLLVKHDIKTFLIGGSYGLRIFTQKDFPTNDIDIFCPMLTPTNQKYSNSNLQAEAAVLAKLYKSPTVRLAKDYYEIVDGVKKLLSVVDSSDAVEDFDEFIVGTVNVVVGDRKVQFVFVNVDGSRIEKWYLNASDLPTCITVDMFQTYFGASDPARAKSVMHGVIHGIRHEARRTKYIEKGFTCPNPFEKH